MAQQVKDPALSLQGPGCLPRRRFDPWPGNFRLMCVWTKKKKKIKKQNNNQPRKTTTLGSPEALQPDVNCSPSAACHPTQSLPRKGSRLSTITSSKQG